VLLWTLRYDAVDMGRYNVLAHLLAGEMSCTPCGGRKVLSYRSSVRTESDVEVRRSPRRRRTVSAYREGNKTVVLVPARFSPAEEQQWVDRMLERLAAREQRRRPTDIRLLTRAQALSARYLDGAAVPSSVRWVDNQRARWGSCTPADGSIRLSRRLLGMPGWVLDYVIVHELAHLIVPDHGPRFWTLVAGYPNTERAKGFLEGVAHAARLEDMDL
jgi:predicted metal-dependent hydrolase